MTIVMGKTVFFLGKPFVNKTVVLMCLENIRTQQASLSGLKIEQF